ncbi:MAG: Kae1-associated serine/threonine protein kinase, partial [Actinobacteria bacterium]|nr:Kae1-associated serine/threonine protein kinase [Actinomycetota bacterium]
IFKTASLDEIKNKCRKIGEYIGKLHNCGIIHGDLTTSNMIAAKDKIVFIDFGLGKFSDLVEDKGVDLLVFKKAIGSIHYEIAEACFKAILEGYKIAEDYEEIIGKVGEIEGRARYTTL